jgi:hypothetical protein
MYTAFNLGVLYRGFSNGTFDKNLMENIDETHFVININNGRMSRTSPKECPKHQGHKGDPGVTPGTCGAGGEKAQVILVWMRAPGVGNASHPRRLGVMRERP